MPDSPLEIRIRPLRNKHSSRDHFALHDQAVENAPSISAEQVPNLVETVENMAKTPSSSIRCIRPNVFRHKTFCFHSSKENSAGRCS